jgi:hypothetical protein
MKKPTSIIIVVLVLSKKFLLSFEDEDEGAIVSWGFGFDY